MVKRTLESKLLKSLKNVPITVILGSRQVGKTTLALEIAKQLLEIDAFYIDLQLDSDLNKLNDP